jgi:hypothetical protein
MIHLGISDHGMIFAVKSITVPKSGRHSTREIRDYKNFVESDFIEEIYNAHASPLGYCMPI